MKGKKKKSEEKKETKEAESCVCSTEISPRNLAGHVRLPPTWPAFLKTSFPSVRANNSPRRLEPVPPNHGSGIDENLLARRGLSPPRTLRARPSSVLGRTTTRSSDDAALLLFLSSSAPHMAHSSGPKTLREALPRWNHCFLTTCDEFGWSPRHY